ncbi:MAG: tRNA (adenosine(37)-N6)-dimethylallyltransferase MiaA [Spirochaetaceae bacterium]|jgi:tRNA dimethylallyltransferase|nr:tRNA (adenosine(37)-N6)-dimethylallyltransferase MiaA [Spirochaetaceae bacterium]
MPEKPVPVVVLFGPTASGKTALLEKLFCGTGIAAEVVSADSMQVYRGLDIGTAKPPPSLTAALPHHLIDILDPSEQFNAGLFASLADAACASIHERGLLPAVSGGAGFYLKTFIYGTPDSPPSDAAIREKLYAEINNGGNAALLAELREADPESAERIHPNDEYRLLRALEVIRLTGQPLSSYAANQGRRDGYRFLLIGLERDRDALYKRINSRCARMFDEGLPAEVRTLFSKGYTPRDPAMRAIGYKEFFVDDYDGGWRLSADLAGIEALIAQHSRQYAKRQITWFKNIPDVAWIKLDESQNSTDAAAAAIRKRIDAFIKE